MVLVEFIGYSCVGLFVILCCFAFWIYLCLRLFVILISLLFSFAYLCGYCCGLWLVLGLVFLGFVCFNVFGYLEDFGVCCLCAGLLSWCTGVSLVVVIALWLMLVFGCHELDVCWGLLDFVWV